MNSRRWHHWQKISSGIAAVLGGCLLAVAASQIERAKVVLQEFHDTGLTNAERAAADLVVDFEAEETTCPACLTTFSTAGAGDGRCPDCGLFLGA